MTETHWLKTGTVNADRSPSPIPDSVLLERFQSSTPEIPAPTVAMRPMSQRVRRRGGDAAGLARVRQLEGTAEGRKATRVGRLRRRRGAGGIVCLSKAGNREGGGGRGASWLSLLSSFQRLSQVVQTAPSSNVAQTLNGEQPAASNSSNRPLIPPSPPSR